MIFFNRKISMFFMLAATLSLFSAGHSKEEQKAGHSKEEQKNETPPVDFQKVSEAFGHLIGKHIDSLGFEFDLSHVIKGISDAVAGKESPLSEADCIQKVSEVQEQAFQRQAAKNLEEAEAFMKTNAQEEGVVQLEQNKLHYKINSKGEGAIVEEHFSPTIRYTGRHLDGTEFSASEEEGLITLDDMIFGFSKGIAGMREGEKRTLFIHPDLGYGTNECLPPNSLLIFDVEVVKANSTHSEIDAPFPVLDTGEEEEVEEIASSISIDDEKAIR